MFVRRPRGEEGATLVMVAAAALLLFGIVAIAVDLAAVRFDLRADRLASDAAATAGVRAMDPFAGTNADEACQVAWDYLLLNLEDEGASASPMDCSPLAGACDPATARVATQSVGSYYVEITHPVPDDDPLMGDQDINPLIDGVSCQRLGVMVERVRDHAFGGILGLSSSTPRVSTVARADPDAGGDEVVPLLVLEPIDCAALFTSGQGKVTVSYDLDTDTPGFIVVDSNASTCGAPNPYSINSMGNQKGWIRAIPVPGKEIPSAILSYALAGIGSANPAASYDPGDLTDPVDPADLTDPNEPPESWFRLYPKPIAVARRITRAPIDHRYNCMTGYPDYPLDLDNLGLGGIPIRDCPDPEARYIDDHVTAYEGPGSPGGSWSTWTTDGGYPCSVGSAIIVESGDWYVDCPVFDINGGSVTFNGSNVVFDGGIDLNSSSVLSINSGATTDHFVYIRDGIILKRAQSTLVLDRTFVYLANGAVDLRAGDGGLTWTAPETEGGEFEDLALWSEAAIPHEIGGQAGNTLTGTFFTPFSEPFGLTGQGGQVQFEAQFITRRLEVKGQGVVEMEPDPDRTTPIPIRAVRLIR